MAQTDTGMGWNAKSEWLMVTSGEMARSLYYEDETNFPGQPIPYIDAVPSMQDVANMGMTIGRHLNRSNYEIRVLSCVKNTFVCRSSATSEYCYFLVPTTSPDWNTKRTYWVAYNPTDGTFLYSYVRSVEYTSHFITTDIRWDSMPEMNPNVDNRLPIHSIDNNLANIIRNAAHSEIVYKLNPGYAVACVATWYDIDGDENTSPILISTNADYATISLDGQTPSTQARYTGLYQGVNFIMSYITNMPQLATTSAVQVDLRQFAAATPKKLFSILVSETFANIIVSDAPDPYQEGEGSEEGGADGEEDEEDAVDFTDPPSTSIGATGLLTIFCPNLYQLQSLGNYMWSTFDVDNWRKIIANPMDAILGLHVIPIPAIITGTKAVKVAGIDTTIDMSYTTVRYIRRPMGSCEIPKKWGAYLDYSPYTKVSIFLPFIGFKELDADDIMGQTVTLQYIIDILTGACVAELKCGDTVLYSWSGNCANEVPISGSDWRGAIASAIGIAATVAGTALVTGGATAPMAASMVASVGANSMNLKPTINRSGAIAGSAGYMGQKRPYIIRSIPNLVIPADQNKFIGYPSFVTTSLGSLTGYNEIASVHLEGIPATGNELAEIETLLKGGVIL